MKNKPFRIGYGYDIHRLEEGLSLTLGGVKIDHTKGIVAHSDGDVVAHALCDALLGALALGDIGTHFPDTSNEFKNIDSMILLSRTYDMIKQRGYTIGNVDIMLSLEKPKIKKYTPEMRSQIAKQLECTIEDISIKATTNEGLGHIGTEQGVEASAVVLLISSDF